MASYLCPPQYVVLVTIIAVGVLFWTAGNKVVGSKLHVTNTVPKAKPDEKVGVLNPVQVKRKFLRNFNDSSCIRREGPFSN